MPKLTHDRAGVDPPSQPGGFHTTSKIGLKRFMTPEGFLMCKDVTVARTGWMIYAPGEVPVKPGPGGYIMVTRDAATLFHPVSIASFAGKSVTNDHPPNGVDPENWQRVTVGTTHNPRRGTGDDNDVLVADLLITDKQAIKGVLAGKVEVSAGYEASYETISEGNARQVQIVGNHIALVHRGRCGPRCAIGDSSPTTTPKGNDMPTPKKRVAVSDAARQMILDAAASLQEDQGDEQDEAGTHVHVHLNGNTAKAADADPDADVTMDDTSPIGKRMKAIEDSVAKVADAVAKLVPVADNTPAETTDAEGTGKTADSAALEAGFKAVLADAEVLVPGFSMPTFDSASLRKVTVDSMCATRRRVLDTFSATQAGKVVLDTVAPGFVVATADCAAVAGAFRAAAGAKKLINNRAAVGDGALRIAADPTAPKVAKAPTIAEIQAANRKQYPVNA